MINTKTVKLKKQLNELLFIIIINLVYSKVNSDVDTNLLLSNTLTK